MEKSKLVINGISCGVTKEKKYTPSMLLPKSLMLPESFGWHITDSNYLFNRDMGIRGSYIVFFTVNGGGIVIIDGQGYSASPNSMIVIPPEKGHKYYTAPGGTWEFYWMHAPQCTFGQYIDWITAKNGYKTSGADVNSAGDKFELLLNSERTGEKSDVFVSKIMSGMFHDIVSQQINQRDNSDIVKAVLDCIETRYMEQITVKEIGESVYASPVQVIRSFKKQTGYTPYAYLKLYRIMKSGELLASGKYTVSETARAVGYCNISHFVSGFKKVKRITPGEYRLRYNNHGV